MVATVLFTGRHFVNRFVCQPWRFEKPCQDHSEHHELAQAHRKPENWQQVEHVPVVALSLSLRLPWPAPPCHEEGRDRATSAPSKARRGSTACELHFAEMGHGFKLNALRSVRKHLKSFTSNTYMIYLNPLPSALHKTHRNVLPVHGTGGSFALRNRTLKG